MKYAAKTEVSADKSRNEIESVLRRYGATGFFYGWEGTDALLGFKMKNMQIKFVLTMPDPNSREFQFTPERRFRRSKQQAHEAWEQATRQRWRALVLVVKAKLEAVEAGIATFEQEFMAHIIMPNGQSVGDYLLPQIAAAYEGGSMPRLLPGVGQAGQ